MKLTKWTYLLLLTLSVQWASPVLSLSATPPQTKICFEPNEAKKVLVEIEYGQLTAQKLLLVQKSYSTCKAINTNNETLVKNLTKDKTDYMNMSESFKKRYEDTNKELIKVKEDQPSRAVWAGIGAGATAILGILLAFLVRK